MTSAITLLSGGMDSTVLLYLLMAKKLPRGGPYHLINGFEPGEFKNVIPLSVYYGQRHSRELDAASEICGTLCIRHRIECNLRAMTPLFKGSSQTDPMVPVPEGHYEAEQMKKTVVPNRNMIMLSVAAAAAISHECQYIAYAAHAGDHAIYPDCRKEFVDAMEKALSLCDYQPPSLLTPFISLSKAAVVSIGLELEVPFKDTYSCYKGGFRHCGKCGTCCERRTAFTEAGVVDPVLYECSLTETLETMNSGR